MTPPDQPRALSDAEVAELQHLAAKALLATAIRRTIRGLLVAAGLAPVMALLLELGWRGPYRVAVVAWLLAMLAATRGFRMWAARVQAHPLRRWWRVP